MGSPRCGQTPQVCRNQRRHQPPGPAPLRCCRRPGPPVTPRSLCRKIGRHNGRLPRRAHFSSTTRSHAPGFQLMRPLTLSRLLLQCLILAAILFCVMVLALKFGAIHVSLYGLGRDLLRVFLGKTSEVSTEYSLILNLRLPRILLGAFVGASLSIAGTSFQALLRNPLADPYVLGVSSGAAVGAIVSLIVEPHLPLAPDIAALFTPIGAFIGAALTVSAVYFLGRRQGQIDSSTLLLAGIVTASFLSAIIMLFMSTLTGGNFRGMAFWMMGDLSTPLPPIVAWVLRLGFFAAAGTIYTTAADLNLLLAGEPEAMHLG